MSFKIEILTSEEAFFNLKQDWQTLVNIVKPDSIFLTFEWLSTWWRVYRPRLSEATPALITVRNQNDQSLVAVLPLFSHLKTFSFGKKFRTLQLLGTEIESSDYLDILCLSEQKIPILRKIFSTPQVVDFFNRFQVLLFENLHDPSILLHEQEELANILNTTAYHYKTKICPFLSLPSTPEQVMALLSRNFRSNLKRARNKFARAGFKIRLVQNAEMMNQAIQDLFALHDQRFRTKQAESKFIFEIRGPFHQQIAKIFLEKNWLQFYQIVDQKKVIGALYCFKFNDTMMYMQGGFDPQYSSYGLGNLIILRAIEDAISLGLKKFDFMRGGESYKLKWTQEKLFLHRVLFPISLQARLFFAWQDLILKGKKLVKILLKRH